MIQERFPEPSQLLAINDDRNRSGSNEEEGDKNNTYSKDSLKLTDDDLKLRDAVLSELEVCSAFTIHFCPLFLSVHLFLFYSSPLVTYRLCLLWKGASIYLYAWMKKNDSC